MLKVEDFQAVALVVAKGGEVALDEVFHDVDQKFLGGLAFRDFDVGVRFEVAIHGDLIIEFEGEEGQPKLSGYPGSIARQVPSSTEDWFLQDRKNFHRYRTPPIKRTLILTVLSLASAGSGYSQIQASAQELDSAMLSGHDKSNVDVLKESSDVVVAVFTSLGFPGSDSTGMADYDQAEIEVASDLRGTLSGKLKVFYNVFAMPGKDQEKPPVLGTRYILFIKKLGPAEYEIKKILPATSDRMNNVKALIASATDGK